MRYICKSFSYLLKHRVGLKGIVEDESLQIPSSIGQLQYNIELVLPEDLRRVIFGTSGLIVQIPQIYELLRIASLRAAHFLYLREPTRLIMLAVP